MKLILHAARFATPSRSSVEPADRTDRNDRSKNLLLRRMGKNVRSFLHMSYRDSSDGMFLLCCACLELQVLCFLVWRDHLPEMSK